MGLTWDNSCVQFNRCKKCGEVIISADRIDDCTFCGAKLTGEWEQSLKNRVEKEEEYHIDDMIGK